MLCEYLLAQDQPKYVLHEDLSGIRKYMIVIGSKST